MQDEQAKNKKELEQLGFDQCFQDQSKLYTKDDICIARVIEVNVGGYKICDGRRNMTAKLSGKFKYDAKNKTEYPTVGDWVAVQEPDEVMATMIHGVMPRKSLLKRKTPGKDVDFQLIAANIDYAFVMQSVDGNFDLNRLERYLVMTNESDIEPIVVLSKTDLISEEELSEINNKIERLRDQYLFLLISNLTGEGLDALRNELKAKQTYCLLGSSGVGKTTLLNTLLGKELFDVAQVREKDSKGMHTTTKRQLVRLETGAIIIDTPGMRELGNFAIETGLEETFALIASYSNNCRFNDCTHTHEDNCAVIVAVEQGKIDEKSYNNFVKIQEEAVFYEKTYVEKKSKNKTIAKQRKNYLKSLKKK